MNYILTVTEIKLRLHYEIAIIRPCSLTIMELSSIPYKRKGWEENLGNMANATYQNLCKTHAFKK